MTLPPYAIARYGVFAAAAIAAISAWLGVSAGASFDFALLRSVFVFVIVTALAFGAEAVLNTGWQPRPIAPAPAPEPEHADE